MSSLSRGVFRLAAAVLFPAVTALSPTQVFGETFQVPGDRARTIRQAIALADANTDTSNIIELATGTYTENLEITKSLTIRGDSGAKVVIRAASSDPLIQIGGATSAVTLERLILRTAGTGVLINSAASVILRNLVITLASTAVQ